MYSPTLIIIIIIIINIICSLSDEALFYFSIVNEDGASIYSVSDEAQKEMPNLDPNDRGAGEETGEPRTNCELEFISNLCNLGAVVFRIGTNFED